MRDHHYKVLRHHVFIYVIVIVRPFLIPSLPVRCTWNSQLLLSVFSFFFRATNDDSGMKILCRRTLEWCSFQPWSKLTHWHNDNDDQWPVRLFITLWLTLLYCWYWFPYLHCEMFPNSEVWKKEIFLLDSGHVCDILQKHLVSIDSDRATDSKSVGRTAGQQVKKRSLACSAEKKKMKKRSVKFNL